MPALNRVVANKELQRLIQLYLKAETDIINEIGRLRSLGLVDYHAQAALDRVQAILRKLESDSWEYVPQMIERNFYVRHPETRKSSARSETPEKHEAGYANAAVLSGEQTDIVQRLTVNLMGQLVQANATAYSTLSSMLIGRIEPDTFRQVGLEQAASVQATGHGVFRAVPEFVEALRREGVTAFVDKAGRQWSLHTYGSMALRTTSRQAEVLSVLTQDPEWDLYRISAHGTTCPLCAPFEGRVYSKSGLDPDFPPLAAAFGKMDKVGPDTLDNSWLNIHPNCLHQMIRWTPMGRSEEEIQKIKDFSSFKKNPPSRDPRTQKQIDAYREKERARSKWLNDYRQWERYRETIPDDTPKTFETFQKHKYALKDDKTGKMVADDKFKGWEKAYRKANALEKREKHDILRDTEYRPISITDEVIQRVPQVRPTGWNQGQAERLQEAHRDLLRAVKDRPAGTEAGRIYKLDMTPASPLIVGKDADHHISMPHYSVPHILIHNHPSGEVFSYADLTSFVMNENMQTLTVVGNSGRVYTVSKTADYDGFHFWTALDDVSSQLEDALNESNIERYIGIIENLLKGAKAYGVDFIRG